VLASFSQQLLYLLSAIEYALMHGRPPKQFPDQPLFVQAVSKRAGGVKKLKLDRRADGDYTGRKLI